MQIKIIRDTWGKLNRNQATTLPDIDKFKLTEGQILNVDEIKDAGNHKLIKASFYLWSEHFTKITPTATTSTPDSVKLPIPYFSQLDNINNPYGSCNVTSVAMCLAYLGHAYDKRQQLEDELYQWLLNHKLSRHNPYDLQTLIRAYGYKDDFTEKAKWKDVEEWLRAGNPIITHGWFTRFGHIVTIAGFDKKGWLVHDPYGEWWESGYDTSVRGEFLNYSYGMMQQICGKDGDLWIHYIKRT